jgi:hypothetical protein
LINNAVFFGPDFDPDDFELEPGTAMLLGIRASSTSGRRT